ncbi:hypothetical protein P20652_3883 [Pseudoalteromonas sp. BSi20652]|nr:hypothetical protein P20652_3883 [Pseudoalteromonas sp. BSi20652]
MYFYHVLSALCDKTIQVMFTCANNRQIKLTASLFRMFFNRVVFYFCI